MNSPQEVAQAEVTATLREMVAYLRTPQNFGFDLPISAEEARIRMLGKANKALAQQLAYGE
jgi:hypothetical protein